jgi:hypothetical protein
MSLSLHSQSFKSTPLEVPATLRDLVAAMPIVIFAKAIRQAFFAGAKKR